MLAFYYPRRLDTIIIATSFDSCLSWSAAPLLVNHAKAVLLLGFQLMYIPFTSPHYNRTLAVRPIVWEWYIRNSKTSYRCLNIISPSYQASSFATGRGSPYYLWCRLTSAHITQAHRPLSLISGVGHSQLSQAHISPQGFTVCLQSRLKHCRTSFFHSINNTINQTTLTAG